MGFLSGLFAGHGQSAADTVRDRQMLVSGTSGGLLRQIQPSLTSGAALFNRLQPGVERGAADLMQVSGPAGQFQAVEALRRRLLAQAMQQFALTRNRLQAGGAGIGGVQGAEIASINAANTGANDLARWYGTPEARLQALKAMYEAQGMAVPLPILQQLGGLIYGNPMPQVGPSFAGQLLSAAGTAAGMGWNPFGSAGSQVGSISPVGNHPPGTSPGGGFGSTWL